MKYIIITSKLHEGFAMFDSKADPFNIVAATPFARDPMKELSAACHELGLGFGFYYSHNQDWTTPGGTGGPTKYADGKPATFEDYFYKKCLPQVKEICTNYGPIDFVWFDTPGNMKKELVLDLAKTVRKLQPNAMLCTGAISPRKEIHCSFRFSIGRRMANFTCQEWMVRSFQQKFWEANPPLQ